MGSLCKNRFEGFGPYSYIHPSTPTQCFNDVVLVPLATWIYLTILILVALSSGSIGAFRSKYTNSRRSSHHSTAQRFLIGLYILLIIGMLALISVEIARLTAANLGIGLLPFGYVGVLMAVIVHFWIRQLPVDGLAAGSGSIRSWRFRCSTSLFWMISAAMTAVAAASAKLEENAGYKRTGQQAMYPVDDVFVDNLTMACLGLVLSGLEFWMT